MVASPYTIDNLHTGDNRVRQVDDSIEVMSADEVPALKLFGTDGEPGINPKFEWLEDVLLAEVSTVNDNPLAVGSVSLTVPSGAGANFQPMSVILIESEMLLVTAVSGDTLTVVRGIASTTAAQHAQTTEIKIIGVAQRDGDDAPQRSTTIPTFSYNFFQAFESAYKITLMEEHTQAYGVQDPDAREFERAMKDAWIKLENTFFRGRRADTGTVGGVTIPRLSGGLDYFLSSAYGTNHYELDLASGRVTEKNVSDMLQAVYKKVGKDKMGRTLLMNAFNKRVFADMYAPYVRQDREVRRGGVVVDVIDTDFGPIDLVLMFRNPDQNIYLVRPEFITVHPYEGLAYADYNLAVDGAYRKRDIYGVYSVKVKNTRSMGCLRNTATA